MEDLKKLLAAATPGPWEVSERTKDWRPQVVSTEHGPICTMHIPEVGDADSNAALICAAVNALPELLAKVKRLEEALKPFADEADKWANCIDKDAQEILIAHPIDVTVDSYGEIDGLNDAAFTLGDLRRARAALKETGQ